MSETENEIAISSPVVDADSKPKLSRALTIGGLVALFLVSFVFFLFLTFPYVVLKESISTEMTQASGYAVQIGDLGTKLPFGVAARDVSVAAPGTTKVLKLDEVDVRLGIFSLLFGKVNTVIVMRTYDKGELTIDLDFGILGFLKGAPVPSAIEVDAQNFPVDDFVSFALNAQAGSTGVNPMVAPLLTGVGFTGKLNGGIKFKLNSSEPSQSNGNANVKIDQAILKLSDPSLGLPDQKFSKAQIKATLTNGNLVFDESSGFVAEELQVKLKGNVAMRSSFPQSQLKLDIGIKLEKDMRDKFGFIIDAAAGGTPRNGELTLQLSGVMGQPVVTPL